MHARVKEVAKRHRDGSLVATGGKEERGKGKRLKLDGPVEYGLSLKHRDIGFFD